MPSHYSLPAGRLTAFALLEDLETKVQRELSEGNLEDVLDHITKSAWSMATNIAAAGRLFGSRRLDALCAEVGRISLQQLSEGKAKENVVDVVFLVSQLTSKEKLIANLIAAQKHKSFLIITADAFYGDTSSLLTDILQKRSVEVMTCPRYLNSYAQVQWIQTQLLERNIQTLFVINDAHHAAMVSAVQPGLAKEIFFFHHCDHTFSLGTYMTIATHVDYRPAGLDNCRHHLGISANVLLPIVGAVGDVERSTELPLRSRFLVKHKLLTVTCGAQVKFDSLYRFSLADEIPNILNATCGTHVHIGELLDDYRQRILNNLERERIDSERFQHMQFVASLWRTLCDLDADVFIDSFPMCGVEYITEAMGAGMPIITHHNYNSRLFSNEDYVYAEAPGWSTSSELKDFLESQTLETLIENGKRSRDFYLAKHSSIALKSALEKLSACDQPDSTPRLGFYELDLEKSFYELMSMSELNCGDFLKKDSIPNFEFSGTKESELRVLADSENVVFGESVELIRMYAWKTSTGMEFSGKWRRGQTPELAVTLGVHILDGGGNILSQADHKLLPLIKADQYLWLDSFVLDEKQLEGAVAIGLAVYDDPQQTLSISGGRCDWGGHRLLLSLEIQ